MFYVPFRPNPNFSGRNDLLAVMERTLHDNRRHGGCVPLVLSGLGGMGKTQLMLKYCYQHENEYAYILWLEVEGRTATLNAFRELAIKLGIIGESSTNADKMLAEKMCEWFQSR